MATKIERYRQQFGARVRRCRKLRGLDLEALATRLGKSRSALSRIETGRQNLTMVDIMALADALEVPASALFGEEAPGSELSEEARQALTTERSALLPETRCRGLVVTLRACANELDAALVTP